MKEYIVTGVTQSFSFVHKLNKTTMEVTSALYPALHTKVIAYLVPTSRRDTYQLFVVIDPIWILFVVFVSVPIAAFMSL